MNTSSKESSLQFDESWYVPASFIAFSESASKNVYQNLIQGILNIEGRLLLLHIMNNDYNKATPGALRIRGY